MIRARSTRFVGSVRDREISSKRSRCSASVSSAIAPRGACRAGRSGQIDLLRIERLLAERAISMHAAARQYDIRATP
jgi:hypothetical protein